ncbi:MAG: HsdM family class I SAM-dependent methyltransferase [Terracidiphilus sp.]
MPAVAGETINEVDFCGKIAAAAGPIFARLQDRCPFVEARIEGVGSTAGRTKRKDLRFYGKEGRLLLTGEVKLPGGVSAFDSELIEDAQQKADHANVQYFFTWDVNTFVLWDRYRQQKSLLDRRIRVWNLRLNLASAQEVARPEILEQITAGFLPDLIADLSDIVTGVRQDWPLPPDEIFLRSLESHLDWPVGLLRSYLCLNSETDRRFDARLQEWMVSQGRQFLRSQPEEWRGAVDNAARTLAYVWTNRFIFYKALRARFPRLPRLELGPAIKTANHAIRRLSEIMRAAAEESGDYETLLFPEERDWANDQVFAPDGAVDAWRGFLRGIEAIDFRDVPADVAGLIFQKLISPEERHRLGQHFTGPDPVDLINSFCIRKADSVVLDPACGSGSFLVRAYYRKRAMNDRRPHSQLLHELYGADIGLYPAHLATLNLAAREINDEANYPRIARTDFFDVEPARPFCELPGGGQQRHRPVMLPPLDAIVGNPPYVRQEKVGRFEKEKYSKRVEDAFPGTVLRGRADLHCYFWPHACRFLKEGGYFGFLTSGQWLDVDYGFALQRWILSNFRIVAILESATERWFPDARVKTCITILERCSDPEKRRANVVRFVRFEKPLAEVVGVLATGGVGKEAETAEMARQSAVDAVRDELERLTHPVPDKRWRVLLKSQGELWDEGVRAGEVLGPDAPEQLLEDEESEEQDEEPGNGQSWLGDNGNGKDYAAGKWGRYLRAPDLYFEVMDRFRERFVSLGSLVDVRFGVKTGCDAFFMPRDMTDEVLSRDLSEKEFKTLCGAPRDEVVRGEVRIVRDGAGTLHPIEAAFLKPEIHSLMKVERPEIRSSELDRVVLLVDRPVSALRGTYVAKYIKFGETATYASKKSKAVPIPQRPSCAGRDPWYDLTKLVDPGFALWPKSQQYRHIVPANSSGVIANCNLYDLSSSVLNKHEQLVLVAILNSTLIGFFKTFYGRFAGTEGNLKTEVVDVNLIEVPDPRRASEDVAKRLTDALRTMKKRNVGGMVEESLMECHSYRRALELASRPIALSEELRQGDRRQLDDAVFELLGVESAQERRAMVDRLYDETAAHFRAIRVTEIQKTEDRRRSGGQRFTAGEQAADAWDALDISDLTPLSDWARNNATAPVQEIAIPDERPVYLGEGSMFDHEVVYFGKRRQEHVVCPSLGTARLLARMAEFGVTGPQVLPSEGEAAMGLLSELEARHEMASARLRELVESRTSDPSTQDEVLAVLERWFVLGRSPLGAKHAAEKGRTTGESGGEASRRG